MSDRPIPYQKVLLQGRKCVKKASRKVVATEVESHGRYASGIPLGGIVTFSDGKVWKWHYSQNTREYYFTIDSGVPSQWAVGNFGRMVAYPKRVAALKTKLAELGLLAPEPKS